MAKILLVEDDKSLREIYGVRLLAEGYDIVSAGDGEEALAMAIKERPNLIVSDVMMPKISGFDMLDILRSTTETKDIKVIMMTALSSEDQRLRGEQLGADRYLVKSQVGIEDVVRTVHEVLGDVPTLAGAQNAFGSSAPSAVPRPAPAVAPRPADPVASQQPSAFASNPAAPTPTAMPAPTAPQPYAPPVGTPIAPQPINIPVNEPSTSLPQPTAPFSTARPTGLADRIIHPLEREEDSSEPIGSLMDKELGQMPQQEPVAPPAPAAPVAPPVPPMPQSIPVVAPPQQPMPQPSVQPVAPPVAQESEQHGIAFEETPRQPQQ
ncbi:response regulator [Candidatus Saccharibacteria bacterium]|nr:response regulator [Candidatus Saccharibacteria bacterium]